MNEMESSVVESARLRGQPIAPYWSSMMVEGYSLGKAELKDLFSSKTGMTWQIVVTHRYFQWTEDMGGRHAADRSKDCPVIGKLYFVAHASAMVLRELLVNGSQLLFDESLVEIDSQWKGLWLSDLLDLRPQLKSFFSVRVVAALSTAEVLQR